MVDLFQGVAYLMLFMCGKGSLFLYLFIFLPRLKKNKTDEQLETYPGILVSWGKKKKFL